MICFDSFPLNKMRGAACNHNFCNDCWAGYLTNAIGLGPACLDLRCPLPECRACVSAWLGVTGGVFCFRSDEHVAVLRANELV